MNDENLTLYSSGYEAKGKTTISPRTLGMYLGCEVETPDGGVERLVRVSMLGSAEQHAVTLKGGMSVTRNRSTVNMKLLLRPPSDITKEEKEEENRRCWKRGRKNKAESVDYLRSLGFDLGGWIIVDGKEQWVASLIEAGVANQTALKNAKG
jgi:hypothetical protein